MNREKRIKLTAVFLATLPVSALINGYIPGLSFFALSIIYFFIYLPHSALTGTSPPPTGTVLPIAYWLSVIMTSLLFTILAASIIDSREPTLKHLTTG